MEQLKPRGVVTLMFTDIEGSTKLLEQLRDEYSIVLEQHRDLLRAAFERWHGFEVDTQGDSFFVAFASADDGLRCAVDIQRKLATHEWPHEVRVLVRIGIHSGEPSVSASGYVGIDVHRAARIGSAAHGGQILISQATQELRSAADDEFELTPIGVYRFKGVDEPLAVLQVNATGLEASFPPIRTSVPDDQSPSPGEPPYKGLLHFDEEDSDQFFGREALVASIAATVRETPFLAVVGASGSGKSSLVRAGVIPALKKSPATDATRTGNDLLVAVMTPTVEPFASLCAALTATLSEPLPDRVATALTTGRMSLGDVMQHRKAVLVVDQFEELFTLCRDQQVREAFISLLMRSAGPEVRVVITLRADFYANVAEFPELRAAVAEHQAYIGPMEAADLRRAIEEPARLGGWQIAPGLVDLLLRDVGAEPGALPLLSHALLETWRRRRGSTMTLKGYFESGEVRGAIARTADRTYADLSERDRVVARQMLLRLTELGEGAQDTRRRASLEELVPDEDGGGKAQAGLVLRRLIDARLVTVDEGNVEVAHEALIREWPQLREWLQEDREGLRIQRQLTDAAAEWTALGREPSLLFRGARLAAAREWTASPHTTLTRRERDFLQASIEAEEQDQHEREQQQRRELEAAQRAAEAERLRAEVQASASRRLRRRAFVLAGAVVVAAVLAVLAVLQTIDARNQATLARAGALASASEAALGRDPELSLLLGTQAVDLARNDATDRQLRRAVAASLIRRRFTGHLRDVIDVSYSADGSSLMTASADGTVRVSDVASGELRKTFAVVAASPVAAAMTTDGELVAVITDSGDVSVWNARAGTAIVSWDSHHGRATDISFSPSGDQIVTTGSDGVVRIWHTRSGHLDLTFPDASEGELASVAYSPDGRLIVTAGPHFLGRIWNAATGEVVRDLVGHTNLVRDAVFSDDGSRIATASADETVRVWDASTGVSTRIIRGHSGEVNAIDFADPDTLATASSDATAAIWDVASGERLNTLVGHNGSVRALAFSPDRTTITTGGKDGTVRGWASDASPSQVTLKGGFLAPVLDADFSPDGAKVVATSSDWTARIFDTVTGAELRALEGHNGAISEAAWSPDGTAVVTASADGTARLWDITTGQLRLTLEGHTAPVATANFNSTGDQIATASDDGTVRLWDAASGTQLRSLVTNTAASAAVFGADTATVIGGDRSGTIYVWDANSGQLQSQLIGHAAAIEYLAVSRDGRSLASVSEDGSIRLWDLATGSTRLELKGEFGNAWKASFSPDGTRLASGGDDGLAHIWDTATGSLLATIRGDVRDVLAVSFAPDGRRLVLANRGSSATIHVCEVCGSTDEVLALARSRATRSLTAQEAAAYLHETPPEAGTASPLATPTLEVELSPAPSAEAPPQPTPPGSSDICSDPEAGFCEVGPGDLHPSVFAPKLAFSLSEPAAALQSRDSVYLDTPSGGIYILRGAAMLGYEGDSTVRIGDRIDDYVAYIRSRGWYEVVSATGATVDNHSAVVVDYRSTGHLTEPLPVLYVNPFPFEAVPGDTTREYVVQLADTHVVIGASTADPEAASSLFAALDDFVKTIDFEDP